MDTMIGADQSEAILTVTERKTNLVMIGELPRGRDSKGLAYSYNDRYFTEFNFGYNGSENFKKGYRFGFFPSVALGWVISNESFMQGMNPWLSFLKLRGSYGLVGNDNLGGRRFAYVSTVNWTGGYQWGYQGDYWRDGLVEGDFGIPDLTWETATKANVGAEIGLFSKFMLQVDLFKEHRKDIFMQRKTIPELAGFQQAPWANFGKVDNKGIDISATYDHQLTRDLALSFRVTSPSRATGSWSMTSLTASRTARGHSRAIR
jgi:hypothetical protein